MTLREKILELRERAEKETGYRRSLLLLTAERLELLEKARREAIAKRKYVK